MYYLTRDRWGVSLDQLTPLPGGHLEEAMRKFLIALTLVLASLALTATAVGADTIGSCC